MKKSTKTTEKLTEEFFAAERTEYEKRVSAAFPRIEVKASSELAGLDEPAEEPTEPMEEKSKGKG
jgi:hypothetical protein